MFPLIQIASFIFLFSLVFLKESLISAIKYSDEEKTIQKIKKCENFSEKEPLDLLIKTAQEKNKLKILQYLEGLKNGRN